tara:strand:- start:3232 stop:4608 length:1377 start_codon:yes stop_codon:yes gene_type:complete
MPYIGKDPGTGLRGRFIYTATANQTTFSGSDSLGRTLTYTDSEYTDVYLNGVKLDKTDYTATSGTSVVLDSGASAGDILEILAFDTFGLFSGDFAQDVTVAGDLTVSGTTTVAATTMTGDLSLADKIVHTGDTNTAIRFPAADTVTIETAASERIRVTDAGKIGIGTTTPENPIEIETANTLGSTFTGTTHGEGLRVTQSSYSSGNFVSLVEAPYQPNGVPNVRMAALFTGSGSSLAFGTSNSFGSGVTNEAMRIDNNGNILLGITSTGTTGAYFDPESLDRTVLFTGSSSASSGITLVAFNNPNGIVGGISTAASSTSFNTSSDYRLKENITDITGAIDRVKTLAPKRFNFKVDPDNKVDGFLAHEAQEVVPEAVTGTKDQTEAIGDLKDADGNVTESKVVKPDTLQEGYTWTETETRPVYQGIDQAKLVPLLTAALKEAIAEIETLKTKVAALEAE